MRVPLAWMRIRDGNGMLRSIDRRLSRQSVCASRLTKDRRAVSRERLARIELGSEPDALAGPARLRRLGYLVRMQQHVNATASRASPPVQMSNDREYGFPDGFGSADAITNDTVAALADFVSMPVCPEVAGRRRSLGYRFEFIGVGQMLRVILFIRAWRYHPRPLPAPLLAPRFRFSCGFASFTLSARPSRSAPFKFVIAS